MIIESWIKRDDSLKNLHLSGHGALEVDDTDPGGCFFSKKKKTHRMQLRCQKTPFPGGFCGVLMWQNSIGSNWWTLSNASIFYSTPGQLSCLECSHSKLQILLAHLENLRQEVLQVGPTYVTVPWVFITSSVRVSETLRTSNESMKKWCWQKKCWTGEKEFFIMIFYHGCHVHRWFSNQSIRPGDPRRGFLLDESSASIRPDSKRLDESR